MNGYFEKQAGKGKFIGDLLKKNWASIAGGTAIPIVADAANRNGAPFAGEWDAVRGTNFILNAGFGALGGGLLKNKDFKGGMITLTGIPAKDLAFKASAGIDKLTAAADAYTQASKNNGTTDSSKSNSLELDPITIGATLLGLGGITAGGVWLHDKLSKKREEETLTLKREEAKKNTKARVRIPGVDGSIDNATELEIPIDTPEIANTLTRQLATAAKKKLRSNAKANSTKKDPVTGKRIPYADWVRLYGSPEEKAEQTEAIFNSMPKYANAPMPGGPPMPPANMMPPPGPGAPPAGPGQQQPLPPLPPATGDAQSTRPVNNPNPAQASGTTGTHYPAPSTNPTSARQATENIHSSMLRLKEMLMGSQPSQQQKPMPPAPAPVPPAANQSPGMPQQPPAPMPGHAPQ